MKTIEHNQLLHLQGGVIDMDTYCKYWEGMVYEALGFNDGDRNEQYAFLAFGMMAKGKCENVF
jgi:hypothetical protein